MKAMLFSPNTIDTKEKTVFSFVSIVFGENSIAFIKYRKVYYTSKITAKRIEVARL